MTLRHPALALVALAMLIVVGAVVIVVAGHAIPYWFPQLALAAVAGGAGLSLPTSSAPPPPPPRPPAA